MIKQEVSPPMISKLRWGQATSSSVTFSVPRGAGGNSNVSFSPASSLNLTDLVPDLVLTLSASFSWLVSPGEEGRELVLVRENSGSGDECRGGGWREGDGVVSW